MRQIFEDRGFQIHAMAYAAVNILLIVINLTLTPEHLYKEFTRSSSVSALSSARRNSSWFEPMPGKCR